MAGIERRFQYGRFNSDGIKTIRLAIRWTVRMEIGAIAYPAKHGPHVVGQALLKFSMMNIFYFV